MHEKTIKQLFNSRDVGQNICLPRWLIDQQSEIVSRSLLRFLSSPRFFPPSLYANLNSFILNLTHIYHNSKRCKDVKVHIKRSEWNETVCIYRRLNLSCCRLRRSSFFSYTFDCISGFYEADHLLQGCHAVCADHGLTFRSNLSLHFGTTVPVAACISTKAKTLIYEASSNSAENTCCTARTLSRK